MKNKLSQASENVCKNNLISNSEKSLTFRNIPSIFACISNILSKNWGPSLLAAFSSPRSYLFDFDSLLMEGQLGSKTNDVHKNEAK